MVIMMHSPLDAFDRRNLLTYLSLLCGLFAMFAAQAGRASLAGIAIAAAVMADTFDGRVARLFVRDGPSRRLGVELDSLADAIAFGAAPIVCTALLTDTQGAALRVLVWTGACGYASCAITRLAFFNVNVAEGPSAGFVGIPVPVAALIWSSSLLVHPSTLTMAIVLTVCAAAMVAPIRLSRPTGMGLAVFTCWPVATVRRRLIMKK
jgi:phosphatidylserine synthase